MSYSLKLDRYGISRHRYLELLNMCRQYDEMRRRLDRIRAGADDPRPSSGASSGIKDPTGNRAARAADSWCAARVHAIEQAAIAADPAICKYIIRNVARRETYERMGVPIGRRQFFERRRKFFWELDQRI